jgi:hypothetical protein
VDSKRAIIRHHVEKIDGVLRTWFEWGLDDEATLIKALVWGFALVCFW